MAASSAGSETTTTSNAASTRPAALIPATVTVVSPSAIGVTVSRGPSSSVVAILAAADRVSK